MGKQREIDRKVIEASRALLYDASTVLQDLARRSPRLFAARLRMLIVEAEDIARELEAWDTMPERYAETPPHSPPDR